MDEDNPIRIYTCKECGNVIDVENGKAWEHECFDTIDHSVHALYADAQNRIYPQLVSESSNEDATNCVDMQSCIVNEENDDQDLIDELIIDAVKEYPALYDYTNIPAKERTKTKINDTWEAIGGKLGMHPHLIKNRWDELKGYYNKKKKLMNLPKPSGSAAKTAATVRANANKFKFYEHMRFLDDVTKPVPSTSSLSTKNSQSTVDYYKSLTTRKQKSNAKGLNTLEKENRKFEQEVLGILKESNEPRDGVDGFLLQVGELIRLVPMPQRLDVEIDTLNLIRDALKKLNH